MAEKKMGRKPQYVKKEEMEEKILKYFKDCEGELLLDEEGEPVIGKLGLIYAKPPKPPTVTGLALALDFNSRQSLLNYQGNREFMDTITHAKSLIEEYVEGRLFDRDGVKGAMFSLINNFRGWSSATKEDTEKQILDKLDEIIGGIDSVSK